MDYKSYAYDLNFVMPELNSPYTTTELKINRIKNYYSNFNIKLETMDTLYILKEFVNLNKGV